MLVYLGREHLYQTGRNTWGTLYSGSCNKPMETAPRREIFWEKGWEEDSRRQKKTNTSHPSARVGFHPGNGLLCLWPVHIDSCQSVFPGYFHLSDAPRLPPPFTWMNYCALNWGCLFPVTEKNTLESRREEDDCERAAGCLLEWWCQS